MCLRPRPCVRLVALLLCALLAAAGCGGGDSGGGGAADTAGGGADTPPGLPDGAATDDSGSGGEDGFVTDQCSPACDPTLCMVCGKGGECVSDCEDDEVCSNGECLPWGDGPACDANLCLELDGDTCVSTCTGAEQCHDGVCEEPPLCDCEPCEDCDTTDIWAPVCAGRCTGDEQCHDGTCEVPPACDCGACEDCDTTDVWAPVCTSRCEGEEQCHVTAAGEVCDVPPACDCDPCEACDQTDVWAPVCVGLCDPLACETCGEDGVTCVSACDAAACEVCDGAGGCASSCDAETEYCRAGDCLEKPVLDCDDVDGFCDGSIIDELVLQPAPGPGEPGCCCDIDEDGVIDNGMATLIEVAEPFLGYDRDYFNEGIAGQIEAGSILIVIEFLGLDDLVTDDYVTFNAYIASDADEDPANNLTGSGEFWVQAASLDANGDPIMSFEAATIEAGHLSGGPATFLMPLDLVGVGEALLMAVEGATISADIAENGVGYGLSAGQVCGWVHRDTVVASVNEFVATSCTCLTLADDFITYDGGAFSCGRVTGNTCGFDVIGQTCDQLATNCPALALVVPAVLDLDLTDDGKGDAISLGVTMGAAGAAIVGEE